MNHVSKALNLAPGKVADTQKIRLAFPPLAIHWELRLPLLTHVFRKLL